MAPPEIADVVHRLSHIQWLMDQLAKTQGDFADQRAATEHIRREIEAARTKLLPLVPLD